MGELSFDGEVFSRNHAHLFTFAGHIAMYDHIFLVQEVTMDTDDGPAEVSMGSYVWKNGVSEEERETYQTAKGFMEQHGYPRHLDLQTIDPNDVKQFERENFYDLEDGVPEEWCE